MDETIREVWLSMAGLAVDAGAVDENADLFAAGIRPTPV